jgi:uncharacterized membrane protein
MFFSTAFFIEPLINLVMMNKNTKKALSMLTAIIIGLVLTVLVIFAVVAIGIGTRSVLYVVSILILTAFSTLGGCLIMKAVFDGLCNWINK